MTTPQGISSKTKLMAIGMFARSTGLTVAALRHYDEAGLLRPAVVDPDSNYRYYLRSQMMDAERIRVMRGLEVPLDEIREYLREPDEVLRRLTLLRHRRRVEQRMTKDAHALEALDRMECAGLDPIAVTIKTLAAQPLAYTRFVTSLDTVEADRRRSIERITAFVRSQGLVFGQSISLCRDTPSDFPRDREDLSPCSPDGRFTVDVGILLQTAVEPGDGIFAGELPGGKVAFAVHEGPYVPLHVVYSAVITWAMRQGYVIDGLPRELYLAGPGDVEAAAYRTEVQVPIL